MATPQVTVSDEGKIGLSLFNDGQETIFNPFTGNINFKRKNLFSGILDDIPGSTAAYSLQLLSRDFKGDALIKVRRTSDNAEATVRAFGDEISLNSVITVTSGSSSALTLGEFVNEEVLAVKEAVDFSTAPADFTMTGSITITYNQTIDGESGVVDLYRESGTTLFSFATTIPAEIGDIIRFRGRARQDTSENNDTLWLRLRTSEQGASANSQPIQAFSSQDQWFDFDVNVTSTIKGNVSLEIGRDGTTYWITDGTRFQFESLFVSKFIDQSNIAVVELYDQSGNERHAIQTTANAQPLVVENGELAEGFKFDGVATNWELPDFAPTVNDTLMAWVNPNALGTVGYIFAINNPGSGADRRINIAWVGTSDVIRLSSPGGLGGNYDSDPVFGGTDWTLVTITVSGREISFYKNGIAAGTATASGDFALTPGTLRIGSRDGAVFFGGLIDHALIYPRALTQPEIQSIMEATDPR